MSRYDFNAPRLFIDAPFATGAEISLSREQANYLVNVLRLAPSAAVLVFNGRDGEWLARLSMASKKHAVLELGERRRALEASPDIFYAFAPLKHARLDYMVQKVVEMGVRRLSPVLTARTQVHRVNTGRVRANAIEAAEQCGILALPEIDEPVAFEKWLDGQAGDRLLIFCDEDAAVADPLAALAGRRGEFAGATVLIGPEGGFDERERKRLMQWPKTLAISLGPRILRADTAGVAALALVQSTLGDWRG